MLTQTKNWLSKLAASMGAPASPESAAITDTTQALRNARLQAHMRALQLKSVLSSLSASLIASIGVASLAAWALWPSLSHVAAIGWLAAIALTSAARLWHRHYILKELVEDARWLFEQLNWVRLGCVANGLLWGALSIWFFPTTIPRRKVF